MVGLYQRAIHDSMRRKSFDKERLHRKVQVFRAVANSQSSIFASFARISKNYQELGTMGQEKVKQS